MRKKWSENLNSPERLSHCDKGLPKYNGTQWQNLLNTDSC